MGMASSDDDLALIESDALLKWAKGFPEGQWSYEYSPTEDESELHKEEVKKHIQRRPHVRNPYDGDKR